MTKENMILNKENFKYSRVLYGLFVLLALYFLIFNNQLESAFTNLGIALIFDPFNQSVPFQNRPLYQRFWLIAHLIVLFTLIGFYVVQRFF